MRHNVFAFLERQGFSSLPDRPRPGLGRGCGVAGAQGHESHISVRGTGPPRGAGRGSAPRSIPANPAHGSSCRRSRSTVIIINMHDAGFLDFCSK